jgi:hypothetical protein
LVVPVAVVVDEVVVSQYPIEHRSSRPAVVVVEQATEPLPAKHPTILIRRYRRAFEQNVVETLVVPLTVVVDEVLADGPPQMALSGDADDKAPRSGRAMRGRESERSR